MKLSQRKCVDSEKLLNLNSSTFLHCAITWDNCILVKFAPHWINALILNLVKTGGCAGPFDHTGEGGHHPLFHGSCPKDPLWVGNPNILEPFILPRFFGLLDPSVCWGRIRLRDVACRAGNSVFWLGAQDSQFFWLPKCVNRNTSD